jgi:hypothetical protein
VWLSNPQGRVSDINTSADKDIDFAGVALRTFRTYCDTVCSMHDIAIRCVELSLKAIDDPKRKEKTYRYCDLYERHESQSHFAGMYSGEFSDGGAEGIDSKVQAPSPHNNLGTGQKGILRFNVAPDEDDEDINRGIKAAKSV